MLTRHVLNSQVAGRAAGARRAGSQAAATVSPTQDVGQHPRSPAGGREAGSRAGSAAAASARRRWRCAIWAGCSGRRRGIRQQ